MPASILLRLRPRDENIRSTIRVGTARSWVADRLALAGLSGRADSDVPAMSMAIISADRPTSATASSRTIRVGVWGERDDIDLASVFPDCGNLLWLNEDAWVVDAVASNRDQHPLAGRTTWDELIDLLAATPSTIMGFEIISPALFSSPWAGLSATVPFPLPSLVFAGLLEHWNEHAPTRLPDDVGRFASECLKVAEFSIVSRKVRTRSVSETGCLGTIRYVSLRNDPHWLTALAALGAFSFYSGIGERTDEGFGLVRPLRG